MRIAVLTCCVLALVFLALTGLSYTPGTSLKISRTELDNGVIIQNVGNIPCLIFVSSLEGVQQFQLAVAEKVTVTDITKPIDIAATGDLTISWEDWERMKKIHEQWVKIKYDVSSNFADS
jgi:hypothetical protein